MTAIDLTAARPRPCLRERKDNWRSTRATRLETQLRCRGDRTDRRILPACREMVVTTPAPGEALYNRAKCNQAGRRGEYGPAMEDAR